MGLIAGVVTLLVGAGAGGVLLASPATLMASLTLVARDECRGAACGAVGLIAFGVLTAVGLGGLRWTAPSTLVVATAGWLVVAGLCYVVMRALIGDEDES